MLAEIFTIDYESKGRGFESRRAHFPKSFENKGFGDFLLHKNSAV